MNKTTRLGLHAGRGLIQVASAYPTFRKVVAEAVQNGLDADATRILIKIDLQKRVASISDNGNGVNETDFNTAIELVCASRKVNAKHKLGRFGIGLIAGLGKCDSFSFVSRPKSGGSFKQWNFDTQAIEACADDIQIPVTERADLNRSAKFSSEINFKGIKRDRFISDVTAEELAAEIKSHYNKAMVRLGTVISIDVVSLDGNIESIEIEGEKYSGRKIETTVTTTKKGAAVRFDLWVAPRNQGQKPAGIVVGEIGSDHTFSFNDFAESSAEWFSSNQDCLKGLRSGLLTGEILGDGVKLHTNRRQFQTDEGLAEFCKAIIDWYNNTGKQILEDERADRKDGRFQDIGRSVLQRLEEIIPNFKQITQVISDAKFGSIGHGHATPNNGTVLDSTLPYKALGSTNGSGNGGGSTSRRNTPRELESGTRNSHTECGNRTSG